MRSLVFSCQFDRRLSARSVIPRQVDQSAVVSLHLIHPVSEQIIHFTFDASVARCSPKRETGRPPDPAFINPRACQRGSRS